MSVGALRAMISNDSARKRSEWAPRPLFTCHTNAGVTSLPQLRGCTSVAVEQIICECTTVTPPTRDNNCVVGSTIAEPCKYHAIRNARHTRQQAFGSAIAQSRAGAACSVRRSGRAGLHALRAAFRQVWCCLARRPRSRCRVTFQPMG